MNIVRVSDPTALPLQDCFEAMYGIPAGSASDVPEMLADHSTRPGFVMVVAFEGSAVVGFGYGFTGEFGQPWTEAMAAALPPGTPWLGGHFEFAEFGVLPSHRRQGIGRAIHDAVFEPLPHDRAILTVLVDNGPARAFYSTRGWEVVLEPFTPGPKTFAILGLNANGLQ